MKDTVFPSIISNFMVSEPWAKKKANLEGFFFERTLEGRRRGVLKHHFRVIRG